MIISRTPFRISIGGGGTDLPFYYSRKGGSLTSAGIDKYMYIIVQKRRFYDEFFIRYLKTEIVKKPDDIQHDLIRESLKLLEIKEPIEVTSVSDIPAGTGLGSSSSFLVGLLNALHALKGERVSKKTLAEEATKIQMDILKTPAGLQDQYAAAFGGIINMSISKAGKVLISPCDISYESVKILEDKLALFYTGIMRSAGDVLSTQKKEVESDEKKVMQMDEIKDIGANIRKSLESGNLKRFGEWMNIHWETKKKVSSKMTSREINKWYDTAMKNGALGGKIMGAGGGGFFMFYVDGNMEKFSRKMESEGLRKMDFKFDFDGSTIVFNSEVQK